MSKPTLAVHKFSSCDGCQLSILNLEDELLDLDSEVVKLIPEPFAVENRVIAVRNEGSSVAVAMTDPENIVINDNLKKILGKSITPLLIGDNTLTDTLEKYYKSIRTTSQVEDAVGDLQFVAVDEDENEITIESKVTDADAPVVKLVNLIITEAIKSNSTDISHPRDIPSHRKHTCTGLQFSFSFLPEPSFALWPEDIP